MILYNWFRFDLSFYLYTAKQLLNFQVQTNPSRLLIVIAVRLNKHMSGQSNGQIVSNIVKLVAVGKFTLSELEKALYHKHGPSIKNTIFFQALLSMVYLCSSNIFRLINYVGFATWVRTIFTLVELSLITKINFS